MPEGQRLHPVYKFMIFSLFIMLVISCTITSLSTAHTQTSILPVAAAQVSDNSTSASSNKDADIEFAANIEMVKAHLAQAGKNKQAGQPDLAMQQVSESLNERYSAILEPRIHSSDASANNTLKTALNNLNDNVGNLTLTDFNSALDNIFSQLDHASAKVLTASEISDPKFNASVVVFVISKANSEYAEATSGEGQVSKQFEYQIAQAFTTRAELVLNQTFFAGNATAEGQRANVIKLFSQLESEMANVRDAARIQSTTDSIQTAIDRMAGISYSPPTSSTDEAALVTYVKNTRNLLNQALAEYKNGNYTGANALATTAYLDNFEYVEAELVKRGQGPLESQTEQMIRIDLRQMINEKAPSDQISNLIDSINQNLDRIVIVVPEFPVASVVASTSAMAFAVIIARRFKKTQDSRV